MNLLEIALLLIGFLLLIKQRTIKMTLDDIVAGNDQILTDLNQLQVDVGARLASDQAQIASLTASQASPATIQLLIDGQAKIRGAVSTIDSLVNPPPSQSTQFAIHELPST